MCYIKSILRDLTLQTHSLSRFSKDRGKTKMSFLVAKRGQILNVTTFFSQARQKIVYYSSFQWFFVHIFSRLEVMVLTDFSAHLTWHEKWNFQSKLHDLYPVFYNFDLKIFLLFKVGKWSVKILKTLDRYPQDEKKSTSPFA